MGISRWILDDAVQHRCVLGLCAQDNNLLLMPIEANDDFTVRVEVHQKENSDFALSKLVLEDFGTLARCRMFRKEQFGCSKPSGYVGLDRGIVVHREPCYDLQRAKESSTCFVEVKRPCAVTENKIEPFGFNNHLQTVFPSGVPHAL